MVARGWLSWSSGGWAGGGVLGLGLGLGLGARARAGGDPGGGFHRRYGGGFRRRRGGGFRCPWVVLPPSHTPKCLQD